MELLVGLFVVGLVGGLYFLPSIVAFSRDHRQRVAIFLLNLLLGWTFLGWVAAIVWSVTATGGAAPNRASRRSRGRLRGRVTPLCSVCGEVLTTDVEAESCPRCGVNLNWEANRRAQREQQRRWEDEAAGLVEPPRRLTLGDVRREAEKKRRPPPKPPPPTLDDLQREAEESGEPGTFGSTQLRVVAIAVVALIAAVIVVEIIVLTS